MDPNARFSNILGFWCMIIVMLGSTVITVATAALGHFETSIIAFTILVGTLGVHFRIQYILDFLRNKERENARKR